jgi:hypothetical protein
MNFPDSMTRTLKRMFDDGIDEVLVFVFVFIFILLAGQSGDGLENNTISGSFLPIILIGAFLLLFFGFGRSDDEQ